MRGDQLLYPVRGKGRNGQIMAQLAHGHGQIVAEGRMIGNQ